MGDWGAVGITLIVEGSLDTENLCVFNMDLISVRFSL